MKFLPAIFNRFNLVITLLSNNLLQEETNVDLLQSYAAHSLFFDKIF